MSAQVLTPDCAQKCNANHVQKKMTASPVIPKGCHIDKGFRKFKFSMTAVVPFLTENQCD